jgi:hypothetical protein
MADYYYLFVYVVYDVVIDDEFRAESEIQQCLLKQVKVMIVDVVFNNYVCV